MRSASSRRIGPSLFGVVSSSHPIRHHRSNLKVAPQVARPSLGGARRPEPPHEPRHPRARGQGGGELNTFEVWGSCVRRFTISCTSRTFARSCLLTLEKHARLRPDRCSAPGWAVDHPSGGRRHPVDRRARWRDRPALRYLEADRDPGPAGGHLPGEAAAGVRAPEDLDPRMGCATWDFQLVCGAVAAIASIWQHSRPAQAFAQGIGTAGPPPAMGAAAQIICE